jgi:replicative DNA helicase
MAQTIIELLTKNAPPQDIGAERTVLGAMVRNPRVAERLSTRLRPSDFLRDAHVRLFTIIGELLEAGRGVDIGLVAAAARQREDATLLELLPELVEEATTNALADEYARIILDRAGQRETIRIATEAVRRAYALDDTARIVTDLGDGVEAIGARIDAAPSSDRDEDLGEVATRVVADLETGKRPEFLPTPFPWLTDTLGRGLLPGELIYLGGRPGVAKSALALEWATLAAQKGFRPLVFSREMTVDALARRVLSQQARVLSAKLRSGDIDRDDFRRLHAVVPRLRAMGVRLDASSASLGQIQRRVARRAWKPTEPATAATGIRFVIVDYVQLVKGPKGTDRRIEIEAVSAGLKALAVRHQVVVLALSSLTPPQPGKGKKRPVPDMASLRESRALEHDADVVLLLHRPEADKPGRKLILDKARDGGTGSCELHFEGAFVTFQEDLDPTAPPPRPEPTPEPARAQDLDPDDPTNELPF